MDFRSVIGNTLSILLRKRGSVIVQFVVCLTLALVSIWVKDILPSITESQVIDQIFTVAGLFNDSLFAGLFLLAPYLLMLSLDIHSRKKDGKTGGMTQKGAPASSEDAPTDLS
jgi:hypothetical protein